MSSGQLCWKFWSFCQIRSHCCIWYWVSDGYLSMYRIARNFGGEFILADWQFWEHSANISSVKTFQCAAIIIHNHSFHVYNRPAAGHTSVIVGMKFTIDSCVRRYHVSKGFWTPEVGEELAYQRHPHDMYAVAVKTDAGVVVGHVPRKIGSLLCFHVRVVQSI